MGRAKREGTGEYRERKGKARGRGGKIEQAFEATAHPRHTWDDEALSAFVLWLASSMSRKSDASKYILTRMGKSHWM